MLSGTGLAGMIGKAERGPEAPLNPDPGLLPELNNRSNKLHRELLPDRPIVSVAGLTVFTFQATFSLGLSQRSP